MTESLCPSSVWRSTSLWSSVPAAVWMNGNLCFHCVVLTSLVVGLNTSAEAYVCSGARSIIDRYLWINVSISFRNRASLKLALDFCR
jgi:hypothetical protein